LILIWPVRGARILVVKERSLSAPLVRLCRRLFLPWPALLTAAVSAERVAFEELIREVVLTEAADAQVSRSPAYKRKQNNMKIIKNIILISPPWP